MVSSKSLNRLSVTIKGGQGGSLEVARARIWLMKILFTALYCVVAVTVGELTDKAGKNYKKRLTLNASFFYDLLFPLGFRLYSYSNNMVLRAIWDNTPEFHL